MRYESPLHLAEEIVALDLLTDRASSSVSPAAPRSRRCRPDRSRPRRGVSRGFRRSRSVVVAGPVRKPVTTGPRGWACPARSSRSSPRPTAVSSACAARTPTTTSTLPGSSCVRVWSGWAGASGSVSWSPARPYAGACGRTWRRAVVLSRAESYLGASL